MVVNLHKHRILVLDACKGSFISDSLNPSCTFDHILGKMHWKLLLYSFYAFFSISLKIYYFSV